ncbi:ArsR family transcriptional regulator [Halomicroarcula sp. GCM10025709]|uniref:DUF7344 domain-containing protein n=1 Tax=Haloarcula TaxID=2237 RepID=UPI0024C34620|nr:hypothetical protein [Halomicroarcula sp. YJ-61-S]
MSRITSSTDEADGTRPNTTVDGGADEEASSQPPDSPAEADPGIAPETAFDILRNSRRRLAIVYLLETEGGAVSLGDLAEHVAAIENGVSREELSSAQRKRVYVSLYQSHLPRMEEAGIVRFDQDRGLVSPGPQAAAVEAYLDPTGRRDSRRCYVAITVAGTALLAVSFLTGTIPGSAVALAVLLAVGICTLVDRLR